MAYSQSQLRALAGMGLVPWVLRDGTGHQPIETAVEEAIEEAVDPTPEQDVRQDVERAGTVSDIPASSDAYTGDTCPDEHDLLQTPLVAIPFRGRHCSQLGNPDASLLILVEAISTQQNHYPFESADAKIFEDMLRSIAWRRQDVCLAVLPPSLQQQTQSLFVVDEPGPSVADLVRSPRDAVLLFRLQLPETHNTDELKITLAPADNGNQQTAAGVGKFAWQLPHPALLRESPDRKRQAWEVLKAARTALG